MMNTIEMLYTMVNRQASSYERHKDRQTVQSEQVFCKELPTDHEKSNTNGRSNLNTWNGNIFINAAIVPSYGK